MVGEGAGRHAGVARHASVPERSGVDRGAGSEPACRMRRPFGAAHFRPPRAARVALDRGGPALSHGARIRGKVMDLAGPWRTSGDWWTVDAWQRDEWDIALSDGALYRLYCEPAGGSWRGAMTKRDRVAGDAMTQRHSETQRSKSLHRACFLCVISASRVSASRSAPACRTSNSTHAPLSVFSKAPAVPEELAGAARSIEHARHGAPGPQRRLRRAALPYGGEEGRRARAHRQRDHLHQRAHLSAAGRDRARATSNLCRLVTRMKLRAPKGEGAATLDEFAEFSRGLICLTRHPDERLLEIFGRHASLRRTAAALTIARRRRTTRRSSSARAASDIPMVATNAPAYAVPGAARAARRLHLHPQSRDARRRPAACWSATPSATSRPPAEMARLFADLPEAIANTREISVAARFHAGRPRLRVPALSRARGPDADDRSCASSPRKARAARYRPYHERARQQIERELALIEKLELAGYFLIVWDIVRFCKEQRHPGAGPRLGGQQRGLLRARHHRGRSRRHGPAVRALPLAKSAASGRISISIFPAATSASAPSSTSTSASANSARP